MKTRGMTLEQRAEWVANATRPALQVGGVRWKLIYDRALEALQDTDAEAHTSLVDAQSPTD